jgi:hypothetical protein
MNIHDKRVIDSLKAGKVTYHRGHGKSMQPVIMDGQKQTLLPVLTDEEAEKVEAKEFITPQNLKEGDAVYCKVGPWIFTHEIIGIRGKPGELEFQIARHDRRKINGWTRIVYGKCIKAED